MDKLIAILEDIRPDVDFEKEERLIDDNIFDSFDIITAVAEINDAYNIHINVAHLTPENMNNVQAIRNLIEISQ